MSGATPASRRIRAFVHRVERACQHAIDLAGLPSAPRLLVGLSGGADSAATLLALAERAPRHGWTLNALHVDHQIADGGTRAGFRDAARAVAAHAAVPCHETAVDVPAAAASQQASLETAARDCRYRALAARAAAVDAHAIVTGHTADDQAETVLLHLIRGSGLDGLAAMPPVAPLPFPDAPPIPLLRPLLDITRRETRDFCAAVGVDYADDPANDDPANLRSRLRRETIPHLATLNPRIAQALGRLAADVQLDRAHLDAETAELAATLLHVQPDGALTLSRSALQAQPPALQRRLLRECVRRLAGLPPTHDRLDALHALLARGGHDVQCGHGVQATASGDQLRISRS